LRQLANKIDAQLANAWTFQPGDRVEWFEPFWIRQTGTAIEPREIGFKPGWLVELDRPRLFGRWCRTRVASVHLRHAVGSTTPPTVIPDQ
jgi:hypothetical protein